MTSDAAPETVAEADGSARRGRRVTMTDVAKAAGCSQATVSLVLNRSPGVKLSAATRTRVIEAARALGYAAPAFAHEEPRPAAAGVIGLLVDQLATSPEAIYAIDGARAAAWAQGRLLMVAETQNDPAMEPRAIEAMRAQGVAGLIYLTLFTRRIEPPPPLRDFGAPVVLLNCYTPDDAFPAVVPDEASGGEAATRRLIAAGHRRIGTVVGEAFMEAARDRLRGYRRALAAAGIPFDARLVHPGDWSASAGHRATAAMLALPDPPTAIFLQNDRMAIGAYEAIKEAGLRIPQDVSVVGYDDEEIARHLHPALTTTVLPLRAMGAWAAERLAAGPPWSGAPRVRLDCPAVERQSVAPRRTAAVEPAEPRDRLGR